MIDDRLRQFAKRCESRKRQCTSGCYSFGRVMRQYRNSITASRPYLLPIGSPARTPMMIPRTMVRSFSERRDALACETALDVASAVEVASG